MCDSLTFRIEHIKWQLRRNPEFKTSFEKGLPVPAYSDLIL
jgi:hypothetical protein